MSKAKRVKNNKVVKAKLIDLKNNEGGGSENKKDKSSYVFQDRKLDWELDIRTRHTLTEKQQAYFDIMTDKKTNIVFLKGCAGTSKTFLSVYAGLTLLNKKSVSDIMYIRAPVEVGKSIGHLPGELEAKVSPYLAPLRDKVEEFLPRDQADKLVKEERLVGTIPNYLRGASWNAKYVIVDETQNIDPVSLVTLISRIGQHSKIIFLFDESQADVRGKVEILRYFDIFNNEESQNMGIHCKAFTREDIVRSKILGYILDRIEGVETKPRIPEPMFEDVAAKNKLT